MDNRFDKAIYKRTHIYSQEKPVEPRHMFKVLAGKIKDTWSNQESFSLLDVGGASGDLVHYLGTQFPKAKISCLEYDPELVRIAKSKVPHATIVEGDANDMHMFKDQAFDITTCVGVISIFDEFEPSLNECIRVTQKSGTLFVITQFNEYAMDVLIRYRRSEDRDGGTYNKGWNLFSKESIIGFLKTHPRVKSWEFEKFVLPFDLAPQQDLIRSWTEITPDGRRVFRNGLQMENNLQFLKISVK